MSIPPTFSSELNPSEVLLLYSDDRFLFTSTVNFAFKRAKQVLPWEEVYHDKAILEVRVVRYMLREEVVVGVVEAIYLQSKKRLFSKMQYEAGPPTQPVRDTVEAAMGTKCMNGHHRTVMKIVKPHEIATITETLSQHSFKHQYFSRLRLSVMFPMMSTGDNAPFAL